MSQKISKTITYFSILVVVIGAIFLANGLILAWSPPTLPPTGGNVPAPINVGPDAQGKIGNLGIGTMSPAAPLSFANSLGDKISLWDGTNNRYGFGIASGELRIYSGTSGQVSFGKYDETTFTEKVKIYNSYSQPEIAIISDNADHYGYLSFFDNSSTRGAYIGYGDIGDHFTLSVENGNDLFIHGGNVGIGTSDPEEKLDVNGNIQFNSTIYTPGRMHIWGGEILYLLNPGGVIIGKEWGGSGNLVVQGDVQADSISGGAWNQILNYYACIDSDGGINYTTAGTVTKKGATWSDYCIPSSVHGNYLVEHYCDGNDDCSSVANYCITLYNHEYSCGSGACQRTCIYATCLAQSIPCDGFWQTDCQCGYGTCSCSTTWCGGGGGPCFAAGTKVTMSDGSLKDIEEITVKEKVLGKDRNINTVLGQQSHPIRKNGKIYSINNKIEATPDHPFLAKDGAWKVIDLALYQSYHSDFKVKATELKIGDILITQSGEEKVNNIELVKDKNPEDMVYDLIVDGDQTYTAGGFIVHTE